MDRRRQLTVFALLLALYTLLVAASYLWFPLDQLSPVQGAPSPTMEIPRWRLALAFAAAHLPAAVVLVGVTSPAGLPPLVLAELFLLNGILGLVAGERYLRDGLVAAVGVHFWADIVWHVIWPLWSGIR